MNIFIGSTFCIWQRKMSLLSVVSDVIDILLNYGWRWHDNTGESSDSMVICIRCIMYSVLNTSRFTQVFQPIALNLVNFRFTWAHLNATIKFQLIATIWYWNYPLISEQINKFSCQDSITFECVWYNNTWMLFFQIPYEIPFFEYVLEEFYWV